MSIINDNIRCFALIGSTIRQGIIAGAGMKPLDEDCDNWKCVDDEYRHAFHLNYIYAPRVYRPD